MIVSASYPCTDQPRLLHAPWFRLRRVASAATRARMPRTLISAAPSDGAADIRARSIRVLNALIAEVPARRQLDEVRRWRLFRVRCTAGRVSALARNVGDRPGKKRYAAAQGVAPPLRAAASRCAALWTAAPDCELDTAAHVTNFVALADRARDLRQRAVLSFVNYYRKTSRDSIGFHSDNENGFAWREPPVIASLQLLGAVRATIGWGSTELQPNLCTQPDLHRLRRRRGALYRRATPAPDGGQAPITAKESGNLLADTAHPKSALKTPARMAAVYCYAVVNLIAFSPAYKLHDPAAEISAWIDGLLTRSSSRPETAAGSHK